MIYIKIINPEMCVHSPIIKLFLSNLSLKIVFLCQKVATNYDWI